MQPRTLAERQARARALFGDAACDEVDARVAAAEAAGEPAPESRVDWTRPDPLGVGWAWAGRTGPGPVPEPSGSLAGDAQSERSSLYRRYAAYAGGAVLAASLLIALGLLIGRAGPGGGREVAFAARVTAVPGQLRNGDRQTTLRVANLSDRRAFVTVVGLDAARSPVEYEDGRSFTTVAPGETTEVELPARRFGRLTHAVVALTATPAGEAVMKGIAAAGLPADPSEARDRVAADLEGFGFTGAAVDLVILIPKDR